MHDARGNLYVVATTAPPRDVCLFTYVATAADGVTVVGPPTSSEERRAIVEAVAEAVAGEVGVVREGTVPNKGG